MKHNFINMHLWCFLYTFPKARIGKGHIPRKGKGNHNLVSCCVSGTVLTLFIDQTRTLRPCMFRVLWFIANPKLELRSIWLQSACSLCPPFLLLCYKNKYFKNLYRSVGMRIVDKTLIRKVGLSKNPLLDWYRELLEERKRKKDSNWASSSSP